MFCAAGPMPIMAIKPDDRSTKSGRKRIATILRFARIIFYLTGQRTDFIEEHLPNAKADLEEDVVGQCKRRRFLPRVRRVPLPQALGRTASRMAGAGFAAR